MRSDPYEGARFFGFAADVKLCVLRRVDENTLIVYRQITREQDQWMVRNIYLLFQVILDDQCIVCIRDMNPINPRINALGYREEWTTCFSWVSARKVSTDEPSASDLEDRSNQNNEQTKPVNGCHRPEQNHMGFELDYAGSWQAGSGLSNQFWERELLQAILRWENFAIAPLLLFDG